MRPAAFASALLGGAVMLAFALRVTAPLEMGPTDPVFGVLALTAFVVSPFAAFLAAAALSRTRSGSGTVLALSLVATFLGGVIYGDAFFRHESPVHALLFLSVPVIQWGLGVAALVAAAVLRGRNQRSTATGGLPSAHGG